MEAYHLLVGGRGANFGVEKLFSVNIIHTLCCMCILFAMVFIKNLPFKMHEIFLLLLSWYHGHIGGWRKEK